jgi:gliding motility-associated-like protein
MKISKFIVLFALLAIARQAAAQLQPTATYYDESGNEVVKTDAVEGDAPLHVRFSVDTSDIDPSAALEWHFNHTGANGSSNVTRYGQETEYDFTESGLTIVTLYVMAGNELTDSASIRVTISSSHLEMPNAFSPNNDDINDIYQAKSNTKSIVDFHAYIFNRWGQKLYEWTDWADEKKGWDGTFNGRPVKDGVYFVLVKARGADGRNYEIKRDVNLLRKHNESTNGGTTE